MGLKIITVGGMIGVGKTSLISQMSQDLQKQGKKVKVVYELWEEHEDNIFTEKVQHDKVIDMLIDMYYENIPGLESNKPNVRMNSLYVTTTHQIHFVSTRASKIILAIEKAKELNLDYLIIDRTIFEDIIFTKLNLGNDQLFWETYYSVWNLWEARLFNEMRNLDVRNIILTAPIDVILERIKKRGREIEQGKELKQYFTDLNKDYVVDLVDNMKEKIGDNYEVIDTTHIDTIELSKKVLN